MRAGVSLDADRPRTEPKNFLRELVEEHQRDGTYGGRVVTRFPPEPNGYLHVGHAKSICLNFGLAREFGGACHLRMDDTNPTTEDTEFVESIQRDVRWLGFEWTGPMRNASDYFEAIYGHAEELVRAGKAYVCPLTEGQMREWRGTISEAGKPSPGRDRSPDENLALLRRMRAGEFADGTYTLRAKIDMSAQNMKMRDPPLYRIRRAHHYRTGDAWCIYPLYDFAHCLSDSLEGITHSICTLEFENNRELYDWILDNVSVPRPQPRQYEFARLNLTFTVLSKRKLLELVGQKLVTGWDDPRMPTISGLRRRGVTPEALRSFAEVIGVAKTNSVVDMALFESCVRDDLDKRCPRLMAVLDPLEVELDGVAEGGKALHAPLYPPGVAPPAGSAAEARTLHVGRRVFVERDDFAETPPKGWHRLAPGATVRLRHAFVIRCDGVEKSPSGEVTKLRATVLRDGEHKPKGTLHWVDAERSVPLEARLYDRLFSEEHPERAEADYKTFLNPRSLVVRHGRAEPALAEPDAPARFQLERLGYFCLDTDSAPGALVANRTVGLRDSWAKEAKRADPEPAKPSEATKPSRSDAPAAQAPAERELPPAAKALVEAHGIGSDEARALASDPALAALFHAARAKGASAPVAAQLVGLDVARAARAEKQDTSSLPFDGGAIAELAELLATGALGAKLARDVVTELVQRGGSPKAIVEARGLAQVSDESALGAAIEGVLAAKADLVARYRAGEQKLFGALLGEVMRATGGRAEPRLATELLRAKLG